jgi:dienelactone hydrolase
LIDKEAVVEIELSSGSPADLHPIIGAKRGVVLVPDLLGRRPLFDELAASLATNHQWHVIVVDPYREHEFETDSIDERSAVVQKLDDDEVVADLVDAADRLEVEPVAVMGFDLGGTYALKAAAALRFDRLVSFYGLVRLPARWRGPNQREPLDLLAHVEDPSTILAVVGTDDVYLPSADVDELVSRGVRVARFPGAKHGFVHDPSAPNHRPKDAAEAWSQVIEHLDVRSVR